MGESGTGRDVVVPRMPWEIDSESSTARQETWLLSFIDILALLLTLFVLLLAFQDRGMSGAGSAGAVDAQISPELFNLLAMPGSASRVHLPEGFAMPGNGLVPLDVAAEMPQAAGKPARSGERSAPGVAEQQKNAAVNSEPSPSPAAVAQADRPAPAEPADVAQVPAAGEDDASSVVAPRVTVETGSLDAAAALPAEPVDQRAAPAAADTPPPVVADAPDTSTAAVFETSQQASVTSRQAAEALRQNLVANALGENVEVITRPGAVNLEIRDNILFAPASAALSDSGLALLEQLAGILRTLPYSVSVEGHTDNVPIHTAVYPSNWELSSARAAMVTRKLIEQGVDSERLRAIGYGDTRPRSGNATAQQRAGNRRVTFVLQVEDPQ